MGIVPSEWCNDALMKGPPDGLPAYRVLTGPDDEAFCRRVSAALAMGFELHQGPTITCRGDEVVVAQAVTWPSADDAR